MSVSSTRHSPHATPWSAHAHGATVHFAGKGPPPGGLERSATSIVGSTCTVSWLEQVHGRVVRRARPGFSGRGDALWSAELENALVITTADCVPVLLASAHTVAAVHAGWRGVAARIVSAACARLRPPQGAVAWIGPAIGTCCYEVGEDVARRVADASADRVVRETASGKLHLSLQEAVRIQLLNACVGEVRIDDRCTHCHPDRLWSYRRCGPRAGRNLSLIWRSTPSPQGNHGPIRG